MSIPVSVQSADGVHVITIDDGKVNALSPATQAAINSALDAAEDAGDAVVLAGRSGILSAGFDLKVLQAGGAEAVAMLRGGFELSARLLSFPRPVVVACTGHAVAMGVFLLMSGDYAVGSRGEFRIAANEVSIGLPMPTPALAVMRHRLTPAAFQRSAVLAQNFNPEQALAAGFVDALAEADEVLELAHSMAAAFASLDAAAHVATKLEARASTLATMRESITRDYGAT
jgi:enoyl-CoA hydratase